MAEPNRSDIRPVSPVLAWVVRVAFTIVFIWNVQCALQFVFDPTSYQASFQLDTGLAGSVAVQGIGVAFLMWNATYPAFIFDPLRFSVLGWVIIIQQVIGLVGESMILAGIGTSASVLALSIFRFVLFDGAGLVLMAIPFTIMVVKSFHASRLRENEDA